MKKIIYLLTLALLILPCISFAQSPDIGFSILPEATIDDNAGNTIISEIGAEAGNVVNKYNEKASELSGNTQDQLALGIMNWDTLLNYLVYIVKFLSQLGIFIGAIMIIYAGYLYAVSIFGGKGENNAKEAIKNAIIGVIVITFSYAIMKAFTAIFLGT